ncbi:hypothetical protein [Ensifer canadensis]
MSRKSAQRFCDNDMGKNKNLKRSKRILEIATRFKSCRSWFANLAVLAVTFVAVVTRRINFGSQERVMNVCFWGSSTTLAAAFVWAIAAAKLTTAP